jgi:REP element-mobilizing transposase RayT
MKLPRSTFHVYNRGARKVSIFADQADRRIFVSLLGRFALKHDVRILSWCLMPNHYHLEPDTDGPRLCGMMRDLDGNYARSFNQRHQSTGCLFQGPFKSTVIEDREGLAYVSRYIHLNPVDLNEAPRSYRWSSCAVYLGTAEAPAWLDAGPVIEALRNEDCSDIESYERYLQAGVDRPRKPRKPDPLEDFHGEWIRHLEEKSIERLTGKESLLAGLPIRSLVCFIAHRLHRVPADTVAEYFGYSSPGSVRTACWRIQNRLDQDPQLQEALSLVDKRASQKCHHSSGEE